MEKINFVRSIDGCKVGRCVTKLGQSGTTGREHSANRRSAVPKQRIKCDLVWEWVVVVSTPPAPYIKFFFYFFHYNPIVNNLCQSNYRKALLAYRVSHGDLYNAIHPELMDSQILLFKRLTKSKKKKLFYIRWENINVFFLLKKLIIAFFYFITFAKVRKW